MLYIVQLPNEEGDVHYNWCINYYTVGTLMGTKATQIPSPLYTAYPSTLRQVAEPIQIFPEVIVADHISGTTSSAYYTMTRILTTHLISKGWLLTPLV